MSQPFSEWELSNEGPFAAFRLTETLLEAHKLPFAQEHLTRDSITRRLRSRLSEAHDLDWNMILDTGFVEAVMSIVVDEHLCGFQKNELTSWSGELFLYKQVRVKVPASSFIAQPLLNTIICRST